MLNIALPKGRLGDKVYGLFSSIGYDCAAIYEDNRKLVFENPERGVRYLLVKPSDVAIYVEHGAADIGVVGKDVLLETASGFVCLTMLMVTSGFRAINRPDASVKVMIPSLSRKFLFSRYRS